MKKLLTIVLAFVLLLSVSAVFAEDAAVETLSPMSLGDLVSWEMTKDDVTKLMAQYPQLDCSDITDDNLGDGYACGVDLDTGESDGYAFYFTTDDVPTLYLVLAQIALPKGSDYEGALKTIMDAYKVADAEEYKGSLVDALTEGEDHYAAAAGDTTVFIMTGKKETDKEPASVKMYMGYKDIIDQLNEQ